MLTKGKKIIRRVAKTHSVSEEYVREKIRLAILDAYNNEETKKRWTELFGENILPTPEEFIITVANMLKK